MLLTLARATGTLNTLRIVRSTVTYLGSQFLRSSVWFVRRKPFARRSRRLPVSQAKPPLDLLVSNSNRIKFGKSTNFAQRRRTPAFVKWRLKTIPKVLTFSLMILSSSQATSLRVTLRFFYSLGSIQVLSIKLLEEAQVYKILRGFLRVTFW